MEGRDADRDKLKQDADKARADFVSLSNVGKALQTEIESRNAIKAEEANANKANLTANPNLPNPGVWNANVANADTRIRQAGSAVQACCNRPRWTTEPEELRFMGIRI